MSDSERWGPGDRSKWHDHGTVLVGKREVSLIYGEHPHSRGDNRHYAVIDEDREPVGFSGHRPCIRLDIREHNYHKSSYLSGDDIRKACDVLVYMNERLVYGQSLRSADAALRWAAFQVPLLLEHPIQLWRGRGDSDFPDLIGRKIYWRDQPGVVRLYFPDQGAAVADYDGSGRGFVTPGHRSLSEQEEIEQDVKDDIMSESWGWFRE